MKLKPLDIHITNSSASLDKLIEQIVIDEIVSKTKSLDETLEMFKQLNKDMALALVLEDEKNGGDSSPTPN